MNQVKHIRFDNNETEIRIQCTQKSCRNEIYIDANENTFETNNAKYIRDLDLTKLCDRKICAEFADTNEANSEFVQKIYDAKILYEAILDNKYINRDIFAILECDKCHTALTLLVFAY